MERHVFPCIYKSFWNNAPKISDTLAFRHRFILLKASCEMFCKCSCKCSRFNYIGFQFSFISVDCLWIVLSVKAKERPSCSSEAWGANSPMLVFSCGRLLSFATRLYLNAIITFPLTFGYLKEYTIF